MTISKENTLQQFFNAIRENESLISAYASRKCSLCYGRGYIEFQPNDEAVGRYMCECVAKKAKKEFIEGQGKSV